MLHIIGLIIKTIGILLLILLGLLLLLFLLILLVPLRYQVWVSYHGKTQAKIRITWLLHLISLQAEYKEGWQTRVRIAKISVHPSQTAQTKDSAEETEEKGEQNKSQKAVHPSNDQEIDQEKTQWKEFERTDGSKDIPEPEEEKKEEKSVQMKPLQESHKMPETPFQTRWECIKTWFFKQKEVWKRKLRQFLQSWEKKKQGVVKAYQFLTSKENQHTCFLLARQGKKIFLHVIPRTVQGNVRFGFEDPARTGEVLAAIAMLYPIYRDQLEITPVFDQDILEGEGNCKGRIRLGTLLVSVLRLVFDKNLRKIGKQLLA